MEATNRSRAQQPGANHRSPSGLSDIRQQMASAARALQAGGRPFEPGTAHPQASSDASALPVFKCRLSRIATLVASPLEAVANRRLRKAKA
jgi:hypothetical protein